jgi:purine nucleosidase
MLCTGYPQDYYFWDVLATAYLAHPEFYEVGEEETMIVTSGKSQGRTKVETWRQKNPRYGKGG